MGMFIIFFTGRRPKDLVGYDKRGYKWLIDWMENILYTMVTDLITKGYDTIGFVTGGAQGFDQCSFWAVDQLKKNHPELPIRNILMLPFKGQERKWAPFGTFSQDEYQKMIHAADETRYSTDPSVSLTGYNEIAKALTDRNTAMLNISNACIGLWPDKDDSYQLSGTKGGTADALRKAIKKRIPIYIVRYRLENGEVAPIQLEQIQ